MDNIYKLVLFILLVFFLINNAKAGKPLNDEDLFDTHSLTSGVEYGYVME